ncbi:MAG TPA: DUF3472 domain-containing protein [Humisphaera sp.]|jgi:hypothetical protein|nr:DUF3472 domain-containing protein [Humisphaera sp.]
MESRWFAGLLIGAMFLQQASAQTRPAACRSVHLFYAAPQGAAFYNEVSIDRSAPGTYFMVCGFHGGYFGMQELANGKKLILFSVWDPGRQNNPNAVKDEQRVQMLYKDDKVRVGRFGGEGTGGQSFFDYDWKPKQTYRFMVTGKTTQDRAEYAGYFYVPEESKWKHLVTFSTLDPAGGALRGYYSFIEDFRRNGISATQERVAHFGNGWVLGKDDKWSALTKAQFTADQTPTLNINAAVDDVKFLLATGGKTENTGATLKSPLIRPAGASEKPADLPQVK